MGAGIHAVELVFLLLLLFVVLFGALAERLKTPYPIVLVIAGLALSFIPAVPRIMLNPDVVFLVVLPPLLFSGAWTTSWRDFRYNMLSIFSLAFGLVAFTVLAVAKVTPWFLPDFDWRMGIVLGAVVAPTDAIAATSVAKRVGLPKRVVDILEGESLVNDASALLALEFGLAMLAGGPLPTFREGAYRLAFLIVIGILVGLVIAEIVHRLEHFIDNAPIEIALSILTPYAAYLAAEELHASGVLSVVACGLYLSRKSSHFFSPDVRLQAWAVWGSLTYVLNGFVFVVIGLQLPHVLEAIRGLSKLHLFGYAASFTAFLILLRLLWVYPGAYLSYYLRRKFLHQHEPTPGARQIFVVGWTGMRGVISLAAALAIPQMIDDRAFVQRNMIIFLAFSVILVTLVLQGLTLPPLIRALGLAGTGGPDGEEKAARKSMLEAALTFLESSRQADGQSEYTGVFDDLEQHYRHRLAVLEDSFSSGDSYSQQHYRRHVDLTRELLELERRTAVNLRNQGRIDDELLRKLERELDLEQERLRAKAS
ncbi:MAG: Na+/H+ antiporter [Proteobacteria bacterium]|nr:MAG: Na+/H+ antiporter [Pseudomonadota bacterium]